MTLTLDSQEVPVRIVGSSVFGRYPTVSVERTYNMFVTYSGDREEEWLVNFSGYRAIRELIEESDAEGRGIFHSVRGGFLIAVVGAAVFRINLVDEVPTQIGTMSGSTGEVIFDENLSSQICFVDTAENIAYIYNYEEAVGAIAPVVFNNVPGGVPADVFTPNYVTYQNTYFIFGNGLTTNAGSQWVVFETGTDGTLGNAYDLNWVTTLTLQTKPDFAKAVLRIPGKGNNIIVFGSTVAELWSNVGGLQIYERNSSINIDFGAISVSTIAANEEVVAWLGINEKSSPAIMAMQGGGAVRISTDGIDYLLDTVNVPSSSTAFLYRQDGHLFYVLTFFDPSDNFTIAYDFTEKKFYDLLDWDSSYFPARQIVYYNNRSYFISLKNTKLFEIGSEFTTYDLFSETDEEDIDLIKQIPRIRLTNTFRFPRPEKFLIKMFTFVVESGTTDEAYADAICRGYIINEVTEQVIYTEDDLPLLVEGGYCFTNIPRIDLTISKNGGITFSNAVASYLKPTGHFKNQIRYNNLGYAQQITYQFRIWSSGRVVMKNGMMEIGN